MLVGAASGAVQGGNNQVLTAVHAVTLSTIPINAQLVGLSFDIPSSSVVKSAGSDNGPSPTRLIATTVTL